MYLEVFADNPFATNCWLLALQDKEEAVVVDPGFSPDRVHDLLRAAGKRPVAVLATHGHFDHVGSAAQFCGDDIACYIHEEDRLALVDPVKWGSSFPVPANPPSIVRTFVEGDLLELAGFSLRVMHTPGHTPGHCAFHFESHRVVFVGDLMCTWNPLSGRIGPQIMPAAFNVSSDQSLASLERIEPLAATIVLPGHGEPWTQGVEAAVARAREAGKS